METPDKCKVLDHSFVKDPIKVLKTAKHHFRGIHGDHHSCNNHYNGVTHSGNSLEAGTSVSQHNSIGNIHYDGISVTKP